MHHVVEGDSGPTFNGVSGVHLETGEVSRISTYGRVLTITKGNRIWVSDGKGMDVFDLNGRRLTHSRGYVSSVASLSDGRVVYVSRGDPDARVQIGSPDGPETSDPVLNVRYGAHAVTAIPGTTQVVVAWSESDASGIDLCEVALGLCRPLLDGLGYSSRVLGVLHTPIAMN